MMKWWKSRGFTDKLYVINLLLTWAFTIVCIVLTVLQSTLGITNLSIISTGFPVVWTELSVHTGFIIWKSKAENMSKWKRKESKENKETNQENIQM